MRQYPSAPTCSRALPRYVKREGRGVEEEVGALLYALVRLLKPDVCVETGLHVGDSAEWIGRALRDNGEGHLHTCDTDASKIEPGRQRLAELPVTIYRCAGADLLRSVLTAGNIIDFAHVDSGSQEERLTELKALDKDTVSPGGLVAFHDACDSCWCNYEAYAQLRDWPHLVLPSLVGVAVFQRPA